MGNINHLIMEALSPSLKFIIHKHQAEKAGLHYDLRIEHNNMLLSWASRKIPNIVAGDVNKIMLFQQPDHEMDWFDFSGTIDDGYGKGKVEIWDKGTYETVKWEEDHYTIIFHGTKIKGPYAIIRYDNNQWLFIKSGAKKKKRRGTPPL